MNEVACNTSLNQKWMFTGPLRHGADATLCRTRRVDGPTAGATLETQVWDYYF